MGRASELLRGAVGAPVADVLLDVGRLVLPVRCPGCGEPDVTLCAGCRSALGPPERCEAGVPRLDRLDGVPPLPVWALAPYAGPVRGLVPAWKDGDRADLTPVLAAAVRSAGRLLAPVVGAALAGEPLLVVPVPTSAAARRRRGADGVAVLARAIAAGLRDGEVAAAARSVLERRRTADQVGLGARARGANASGGFRVRRRTLARAEVTGRWVLVVDDVVTTGSTLVACVDALRGQGALVLGAVALAATPPPRRRGTPGPSPMPGRRLPSVHGAPPAPTAGPRPDAGRGP